MDKKTVVAIHQPNFLPWLGYFHKMIHSDIFVFLDDVQFPRGKSFGSRVLIKSPNGSQWISVPVAGKSEKNHFNSVGISDLSWLKKILKSFRFNYQKAPYFKEIYPGLEEIFNKEFHLLIDLNIGLITYVVNYLGISTKLYLSSSLSAKQEMPSEEKIIFLLKTLGANHYVSGSGAGSRRYIDENEFVAHNIHLIWQHFNHPVYPQLYGEFIPNLSIIDLIFNCGKQKSLQILQDIPLNTNELSR